MKIVKSILLTSFLVVSAFGANCVDVIKNIKVVEVQKLYKSVVVKEPCKVCSTKCVTVKKRILVDNYRPIGSVSNSDKTAMALANHVYAKPVDALDCKKVTECKTSYKSKVVNVVTGYKNIAYYNGKRYESIYHKPLKTLPLDVKACCIVIK
jgi:uncharacterized protein YcfJ